MQDISTWLLQYCDVKSSMQMTDEDGIKNGLYRFDVVLRKDDETKEVRHLPPVIQIGTVRGHVFYPGQPQVCRRCGSEGHKAVECEVIKCRNCKEEGHSTRECRKPIKCNLCGQEAHVFRDCPVSYANVVRRKGRNEEKVIALLDEESKEEREVQETKSESLQGAERRKDDKIEIINSAGTRRREYEEEEEFKNSGENDFLGFSGREDRDYDSRKETGAVIAKYFIPYRRDYGNIKWSGKFVSITAAGNGRKSRSGKDKRKPRSDTS
ncbi:ZCHC3 protein, partial [Polypterus senegalus]